MLWILVSLFLSVGLVCTESWPNWWWNRMVLTRNNGKLIKFEKMNRLLLLFMILVLHQRKKIVIYNKLDSVQMRSNLPSHHFQWISKMQLTICTGISDILSNNNYCFLNYRESPRSHFSQPFNLSDLNLCASCWKSYRAYGPKSYCLFIST